MATTKSNSKTKTIQTARQYRRAFASSVHLEGYLRNNPNEFGLMGSEFRLVVMNDNKEGGLQIYINPLNRDGESYDGYLKDFTIDPKNAIDNLLKYLSANTRSPKGLK